MTVFTVGDAVEARDSVQGLVKGTRYTVTETWIVDVVFGTFVTYILDDKLEVRNGHLVLCKVQDTKGQVQS